MLCYQTLPTSLDTLSALAKMVALESVCLKGEKFCSLVLEAFQSTSCFTAWISALFPVAELDNAMQFSNMLGPSESVRVPVA